MSSRVYISPLLLCFAGCWLACKKLYAPPAITASNSYLVVEGTIDAGSDSTLIKLSRSVKISSKATSKPENNAVVTVQSDDNSSYPLTEVRTGVYGSIGLNLDRSHKYRLDIKTSDAKEYQSDYVTVTNSPPIDSVYYTVQNDGVNVWVDTHDPKNNTHYYRWAYDETWIIRSHYKSHYESNGDTVLPRDMVSRNIWQCWQNDTSSSIVVATSAKLNSDVISQQKLTFIPSTSEKFTAEYSIKVKQYALAPEAFNFWQNIKRNTEQIGSIFDAQPSEINGNIRCISNPSEPVIGYLSVGSPSVQRIFISQRHLPAWEPTPVYAFCELVKDCCTYKASSVFGPINQVNTYMNPNYHLNNGSYYIPIDAIGVPGYPPIGYTATSIPICVDCTIRGSNKQPDFWVYY